MKSVFGPRSATPNTSGAKTRILLAEDNVIASELIAMMARRLGNRIDCASNGLDAVDLVHRAQAKGDPYAILLLDAMMPVLTGVETARRLRHDGITAEELPIVAVTAATDPAEIREYLAAGMQAYLSKPVSIAELSGCIEAWVPRSARPAQSGLPRPSDSLRRRYDLRKTEVLERFELAVAASSLAPELAAELREHLHKLAGTAGSFGETELSAAAARGEALLVDAADADLRTAVVATLELLKAAA